MKTIELTDDKIDMLRYVVRREQLKLLKQREGLVRKFGKAADLSRVNNKLNLCAKLRADLGSDEHADDEHTDAAEPRYFQGPGTSGHPRDCGCAACRNFDD